MLEIKFLEYRNRILYYVMTWSSTDDFEVFSADEIGQLLGGN